jgi:hypothetical protein
MTGLKPLHVLAILSSLIATQARAQVVHVSEVAAACVAGQAPGVCGGPIWLDDTIGDHGSKKSVLSPEFNAPQANEPDKSRVGWPANMILG